MSKARVCGGFPFVPLLVFLLAVAIVQPAAADDVDAEDAAAVDVDADDVEFDLLAIELPVRSWFDTLVLGGEGETAVAAARRRLERAVKERVADIAGDVEVSAVQGRKLELAGRGDIDRLFERIADCRRRCERAPEDARLRGEAA